MKLMTKELERKFKKFPFGSQEGLGKNAEVVVKYFSPMGRATWLITEGEKLSDGDWLFYGLCRISEDEWGYVALSELESVRLPFGLGIERDLYVSNGSRVSSLI